MSAKPTYDLRWNVPMQRTGLTEDDVRETIESSPSMHEVAAARELLAKIEDAKVCSYRWPLPPWAGEDQMDRCRCDLPSGHDGPHMCDHLWSGVQP